MNFPEVQGWDTVSRNPPSDSWTQRQVAGGVPIPMGENNTTWKNGRMEDGGSAARWNSQRFRGERNWKDVNMFDCGEWTARMLPKYVIENTENTSWPQHWITGIRFYLPIVKGQRLIKRHFCKESKSLMNKQHKPSVQFPPNFRWLKSYCSWFIRREKPPGMLINFL